MRRVDGYDVDAFVQNITAEKPRRNAMANTYNRINQRIDITGIGGTNGQSVWEYYDEVDKITRGDPSINPHLHLESTNRGWVTGSHYYHVHDYVAIYDNSGNNIAIIIIIIIKNELLTFFLIHQGQFS